MASIISVNKVYVVDCVWKIDAILFYWQCSLKICFIHLMKALAEKLWEH